MRIFLITLILGLSSCEENEQMILIENLNCANSTDHYVNFKLGEEEFCWNDENPVRFDNGNTGRCGQGYENEENQYLATGIRPYICSPSIYDCQSVLKSIIFRISFPCSSFKTQEQFYQLIKLGNYQFAKTNPDFGKFQIEYYENNTWYTTISGNQANSRFEVLEINEIAPDFIVLEDGSKNGQPAALDITLQAAFNLYSRDGQFFKRINGSKLKGLFYRPSPSGEEWEDYYGE